MSPWIINLNLTFIQKALKVSIYIWYEKVVEKIAPPELIHSGSCTNVTGSFKFDENI